MTIIKPDIVTKLLLIVTTVCAAISSFVVSMAIPDIFRGFVDALDRPYAEFLTYLGWLVLAIFVSALVKGVDQFALLRIQKQLILSAEEDVIAGYLKLPYWLDGEVPDDALHRLRKDVPEYIQNIVSVYSQGVYALLQIAFLSIYSVSISPMFLFIGVIVAAAALLIISRAALCLPELMKTLRDWMGKLHMLGWEQVANREIAPLLRADKVTKNFRESADQYSRFQTRILTVMNISKKMQDAAIGFLTISIALFGGGMMLAKRMNLADVLTLVMVISMLMSAVFSLPALLVSAKSAQGIKKRIRELYVYKADTGKTSAQTPANIESVSGTKNTNIIKSIESLTLSDIRCHYPKADKPMRYKISLVARQGDFIRLAGESGKGKSTVFRVLMRIMPLDGGSYLVNGIDSRSVDRDAFWSRTLYLPQEPQTFKGSLLDNITLFRSNAVEPARVRNAIEKAGLTGYVAELKNGIDSDMDSLAMSSGEMQRLCLARAFCLDYDLLLLDEPTSKIDPFSEESIIKNIAEEIHTKGKIGIVSSHRTTFDAHLDNVLEFEVSN